jgi:hypothetical protein
MRTIAFRREFVTITGTINAALLLSQILYWSRRTTKPGKWFYKSSSDWMEETGLTRHQLNSARSQLVRLNIVSEIRRGIPATVNFRLNFDILDELLELRCPKSGQLNVRKAANLLSVKPSSNSEMTSEMTPEKERRGPHSSRSARARARAVKEIFCPKVRYPESECEMELMLEECGIEYNPDYDGKFFYTMQRNGWCIRGEMVYDWPATYKARVEFATEH